MSLEEANIIRKRAETFLRNAERLISVGEWDLATFNLEQYCQLMLKYRLLVTRGSCSRSHSLRTIIRILSQDAPELISLIEDTDKLHNVARLEEAYIVARYLPYMFEEREVKDLHRFVLEVFKHPVERL
ncbi:HEPN domain-containing protein [Candidatus Bathyarchaeota archaeon]|nr:HEPN domain-containing protein [Candidatus Bathyarchaeota archaeon]